MAARFFELDANGDIQEVGHQLTSEAVGQAASETPATPDKIFQVQKDSSGKLAVPMEYQAEMTAAQVENICV